MLFQKGELLLPVGRLAREQLANRSQAVGAVRKGDFACLFQGIAVVLTLAGEQC